MKVDMSCDVLQCVSGIAITMNELLLLVSIIMLLTLKSAGRILQKWNKMSSILEFEKNFYPWYLINLYRGPLDVIIPWPLPERVSKSLKGEHICTSWFWKHFTSLLKGSFSSELKVWKPWNLFKTKKFKCLQPSQLVLRLP